MICSSRRDRSVFFSFVCWMNRSCSGCRPGAAWGSCSRKRATPDALQSGALREVGEEREVEHQRRRQDRIAAEKVHLDLHRIAHPPDNVDVIPAFLVVTPGAVEVDANDVREVAIQRGVRSGWRIEWSTLSFDSSLVLNDAGSSRTSPSRFPRILVEYQPASPSMRAFSRGDHGLEPGLPRLEVLARHGNAPFWPGGPGRGYPPSGSARRWRGRSLHDRGIRVEHGGGDALIVASIARFERLHWRAPDPV